MNASGTHAGWIVKHVEIPFQVRSMGLHNRCAGVHVETEANDVADSQHHVRHIERRSFHRHGDLGARVGRRLAVHPRR